VELSGTSSDEEATPLPTADSAVDSAPNRSPPSPAPRVVARRVRSRRVRAAATPAAVQDDAPAPAAAPFQTAVAREPTAQQPLQQQRGRGGSGNASSILSVGGQWRALRSVALLALLMAGPIALLARQPALLSQLTRALRGGGAEPASFPGMPLQPQGAAAYAASSAAGAPQQQQQQRVDSASALNAITQVLQLLPFSSSLPGGWSGPAAGGAPLSASSGGGSGSQRNAQPARLSTAQAAVAGSGTSASTAVGGDQAPAGPPIQMISVVADGEASHPGFKDAPWGDVIRHMTDRLRWSDPRFKLDVIGEAELKVS